MIKVRPLIEAFMYGSVFSEGIGNEQNPIRFLLGDLSSDASRVTGPTGPNQLSMIEIVMNDANYSRTATHSSGRQYQQTVGGVGAAGGAPALTMAIDNINANFGDMALKTLAIGGGFTLFNKVMSKPINKMNKAIRDAGFGGVVQI